jgi:4-hydroxybenzoate polyprenyltransferase
LAPFWEAVLSDWSKAWLNLDNLPIFDKSIIFGRAKVHFMTRHLPLTVDLDGTFFVTDTLVEGVIAAAFQNPIKTTIACARIFQGRPALKKRIGEIGSLDIGTLPIRQDLLEYLKAEKASGRKIHLVTAADQSIANEVGSRFDVFDHVHGTNGNINLKGDKKQSYLRNLFPEGYVYAGDSSADLKVWSDANGIILAGASSETCRKAHALGVPIEAEFQNINRPFKSWLKALRIHQWAKNALLFIPLLLSGLYSEQIEIFTAFAAFTLLGLTASGTYILNDLVDLSADRRHRTKKNRPWASGALFIGYGVIAGPALIALGLIGSFILSFPFGLSLLAYLVLTLSYSIGLKQVAILDVFVLASLFTLRLVMGTVAIDAAISQWLLTFSMFFFFSLSLAKRHVELVAAKPGTSIPGRGYYSEDAPITLNVGLAGGVASILIMVLYLAEEAFPSGQYSSPEWLWVAPMSISLWIMRIWLLAHRGDLDDDPVAFAIKDKLSMILGGIIGAAFFGAALL